MGKYFFNEIHNSSQSHIYLLNLGQYCDVEFLVSRKATLNFPQTKSMYLSPALKSARLEKHVPVCCFQTGALSKRIALEKAKMDSSDRTNLYKYFSVTLL